MREKKRKRPTSTKHLLIMVDGEGSGDQREEVSGGIVPSLMGQYSQASFITALHEQKYQNEIWMTR